MIDLIPFLLVLLILYFQIQSLGNNLPVCLPLVFLWRLVSPVSDKRALELLINDLCARLLRSQVSSQHL